MYLQIQGVHCNFMLIGIIEISIRLWQITLQWSTIKSTQDRKRQRNINLAVIILITVYL